MNGERSRSPTKTWTQIRSTESRARNRYGQLVRDRCTFETKKNATDARWTQSRLQLTRDAQTLNTTDTTTNRSIEVITTIATNEKKGIRHSLSEKAHQIWICTWDMTTNTTSISENGSTPKTQPFQRHAKDPVRVTTLTSHRELTERFAVTPTRGNRRCA